MSENNGLSPFRWDVAFSYESIGFSLAKLWPFLVWFGYAGSDVLDDSFGVRSLSHSLSLVALFVALFATSRLAKDNDLSIRKIALASALLDVFGAMALIASAQVSDLVVSSVLCVTSAIATGVGSALLNICWGFSYSRADQSKIVGAATVAFLLWGFLFYSGQLLPLPLYCAFVVVCPVFSAMISVRAYETACRESTWETNALKTADFVKVSIGVAFFGVLSGIMFSIPMAASSDVSSSFQDYFFLSAAIVFVAVAAIVKCRPKTFSFSRMYKASTLVIVLAILLSPIADWVYIAFLFGYVFFSLVVWIRCSDISSRLKASPLAVFGVVMGSLYLGLFVGDTLANQFIVRAYYSDPTSKFVIPIVVAALALLASYFGLLDVRADEGPESKEASSFGDSIAQACADLSLQYGLSERQSEILEELARGHSSKIIQETLLISAGTVNSHISAIYRKMDIHSRDELVRIVSRMLDETDRKAR